VVFGFDFKVFVQLVIHFIVRGVLGRTYLYCGTRPIEPFSGGRRFCFLLTRKPFLHFWRREPFLEEGAVSGGGSRFWRREPFLEEEAVSASVEGEGAPFIEYGVRR
jgi:hypothetical protein